jgi:N-acetylglutamate synthase/N-acetylornithine aminotransferase
MKRLNAVDTIRIAALRTIVTRCAGHRREHQLKGVQMETQSMIPLGFRAAGIACGIKKNGDPDLGAIVSDRPAAAAAVFTRNRVKAAPVQLDMERIGSGAARRCVVNSGNANCCRRTGAGGCP